MKYKILVAEDDKDILNLIKLYLENEDFEVVVAENGLKALNIAQSTKIDLAVLDIMMPQMDGYELIKKIREFSNIPILILSAKNQDIDKILGLNIGADDYLTKPFNPLEIIARVKANLRRFYKLNPDNNNTQSNSKIILGNLTLDTNSCSLEKDGVEILLTPMEYKILALFMKSPNRIYTKAQIYENISGEFFESDENTVMVHISRLRDKIEDDAKNPCFIKTIRGLGYKIEYKK